MPDQLTPSVPDRQRQISGDPKRVEEQQSESDVEITCNFKTGSPLTNSDDRRDYDVDPGYDPSIDSSHLNQGGDPRELETESPDSSNIRVIGNINRADAMD